jgi:hypothetical protein
LSQSGVCVPMITFDMPSVQLPFGVELKATADFSKGPPTQCAMLANLLVQLAPALAAMSPVFKILKVFSAMKDFFGPPPNPFKAGDVVTAIEGVISMIDPAQFLPVIKSILLLLIAYLNCFIEAMTSLLEFQARIDLSIAVGNPDLQASLQCANANAATSMQQMMQALGPLGPVMELIQPIIGISGLPINLPKISDLQAEKDVEQALKKLSAMLTQLQQIIQMIPA